MKNQTYTSIQLPDIVSRATDLAIRLNFPLMPGGWPIGHKGPPSACIPEVGRLLRILVASKPDGLIAEHGTGAGIGTAWMASGLLGHARLISAELDPNLAAEVQRLFSDYPNVEIRKGDWHEVMSQDEPYDLLFMDATPKEDLDDSNWDNLTGLVKVGGQIVMDDLTPVELWPAECKVTVDLKREFALGNPRVIATEVRTTPSTAALIMTRIL